MNRVIEVLVVAAVLSAGVIFWSGGDRSARTVQQMDNGQ